MHVLHPRELCVYFAVSAECAIRAHVLVLAWDGGSFSGTGFTRSYTYIHKT
jgi:hypothetical protein